MAVSAGLRSKIIYWLKMILPIVAIGILSTVFLIDNEQTLEPGLEFSDADFESASDGLKITKPDYSGISDSGEKFRLSADWALPEGGRSKKVELSELRGEVEQQNGNVIKLSAPSASFDAGEKSVHLKNMVTIETSDGISAKVDGLHMDMKKGLIESEGIVTAQSQIGTIEAGKMRVSTSNEGNSNIEVDVVEFESGVKVTYTPKKSGQ